MADKTRTTGGDDIRFIEETVKRSLGIKRLSDRQWRALSQLLGESLAVGRKTYEPISETELQRNLENLKISSKITEAIQNLAGAQPADAVHLATWPVQRKIHLRAIPAVQEWLAAYRQILEQGELGMAQPSDPERNAALSMGWPISPVT